VAFPQGRDGTVVTLTHSGGERRDDADRARAGYETGWPIVLRRSEQQAAIEQSGRANSLTLTRMARTCR
jgi:hypothetical protein